MALSNASLGALGQARDNNSTATTETKLGVSSSERKLSQYEVTSITITGPTSVGDPATQSYGLTLSGGAQISELQASGRNNRSPEWLASILSGDFITLTTYSPTNSGATVDSELKSGFPSGSYRVGVTWSDTYNTTSADTHDVSCSAA